MEAIGVASGVGALVQQSFQLLDRVQVALDRQKDNAMHLTTVHLTTVMCDVEGTKSIVKRIQKNPKLQGGHLKLVLEELLDIARKLSTLVSDQEAKSKTNGGFRLFTHNFVKGPKEQQELERLRGDLLASKNTLTLGVIVELAPSGTSLLVNNMKMSGMAYARNGRVIRQEKDKDFDHITVQGVEMTGAALMMNSTVTGTQQDKLAKDYDRRATLEQLTGLMKDPTTDAKLKNKIF